MRDSKGTFVALVSHDGVFCERFIDSASPWEILGQKLVLNTKDPQSPETPIGPGSGDRDNKTDERFPPRCAAWGWAVLGLQHRMTAIWAPGGP
jgi:hypothetical protein